MLDDCCPVNLRRAMASGTVVASAAIEDFSLGGLERLDVGELERRYQTLREIVQFEALELASI
jgi:hypothetical protein